MRVRAMCVALTSLMAMSAWCALGTFDRACHVQAGEPQASRRDADWVHQRVAAWQPTKEERAFDEIGWARDIREAMRLAQEHGRPVFLFTYDGANLACYRC